LNFTTDQRAYCGADCGSDVAIADVLADGATDDSADCGSGDAVRVFWIGHRCNGLIPAFLLSAGASSARRWLAEVRIGRSCPGYRNTDACDHSNPRCFVHLASPCLDCLRDCAGKVLAVL
jgi:hypothetical protein